MTDQAAAPQPRSHWRKRLAIGLAAIVGVVALFGLLGYFWLPGFAKGKLETLLSEQLRRPVTIAAIEISPYALTATVRGFRVGEKAGGADAGQAALAFDELFVDLSAAALTQRAPVISEVRLKSPSLRLVREAEGRYNVSDLVEEWLNKPDDGSKTYFSVSNVLVEGGRIEFIDQPKASRQEITDLRLGIPFIANFASDVEIWVEPHFAARVDGAPLTLSGKARPFAKHREASLAIRLDDFDLTRIDEYVPVPIAARLLSARLDSDLSLVFAQPVGQTPTVTLSGEVALRQVELAEAGGEAKSARRLLRLPRLALRLARADLGGTVAIERITVDGPEVSLRRGADGRIDWLSLLPPSPPHRNGPPAAAAPAVSVAELTVSKGRLRFDDAAAQTPYALVVGDLGLKLAGFDLAAAKPARLDLALADIRLDRRGDKAPMASVGRLSLDAATLDLAAQGLAVGALTIDGARLATRREADGSLDIGRLLPAAKAGAPAATGKPWQVRVKRLALTGSALRFEDRTLATVVPFVVDPLTLSVDDLDLAGTTPARLSLAASVNRRGVLKTTGSLAWAPLAADLRLDLKDIELVPLQGWAAGRLNALVTRGALSFHGDVKAAGSPLKVALRGDGRLTDFNLLDKLNATDLLRWRSLDLGDLDVTTQPVRVDVGSVALADFFARIMISAEGKLNLRELVRHDAEPAPPPAETAKTAAAPPPAAPTPVRIGRITLQGGNVNFSDRFIKPNYSANLTGLGGRIGPLVAGTPGEVEIRGAVDRTAPLEILGKIDPFGPELALDIAATAKGVDLPKFSPYSGKYVGYAIEKGKLSMNVHYRVDKGLLTAENNVFLDQLSFGDKIESPDALSLPVNLAVALLKNRRGEIDINLPISGSLNDPEFSVGGIIVKIIVNLIVKAVTSPFALLGSLFGGGEELSRVEFAPGRAALTPVTTKSLESLAKALADRPGLRLEITGRADPDNDREGLKRALLERKVKAAKLADQVRRGEAGGSLREVEVGPDEYAKFLELAYKDEKFPKPKNLIGLTKSLPVPEMEQLILANLPAGEDEMRQLADRRARAARDWLVGTGGIAAERIFVLAPKVEAEADGKVVGSRAEFSLR